MVNHRGTYNNARFNARPQLVHVCVRARARAYYICEYAALPKRHTISDLTRNNYKSSGVQIINLVVFFICNYDIRFGTIDDDFEIRIFFYYIS